MKLFAPPRRLLPLIGVLVTGSLLLVAFVLGLVSFGKMQKVVTEEFNGQQLVLAQNLAALIQQDLDFLRRELAVLNLSPSIQYNESPSFGSRMGVTFSSIQGGELLEIRKVSETGGEATVMSGAGQLAKEQGRFAEDPYYAWAKLGSSQSHILMAEPTAALKARYPSRPLVLLATPNYQSSPDEAHPKPTGRFSGVLIFLVDPAAVARRFSENARSGTTGYAWVIDDRGTFLYHPVPAFVGQNAFSARTKLTPGLGFEGINSIMRDHMLTGQHGTGEYVSGWHHGVVKPVQKLIGYWPARIDADRPDRLWSVAVVAPASEAQGLVRSLFLRQLFIQAALVLALLAGGVSVFRLERYWAQIQKERERQVNLSSRLASLGTLAAGVAHEINNPLAIILGFTDLLLEQNPEGSQAHDHLKIIERQGLACKKIVENLGRFARTPEPGLGRTDLNEVVRRTVAMVQNTLLTEKIDCRTDLQENLPPANGDPQGIQQVLLNLITNARGAMKDGGVLTIRTSRSGDGVGVSVGDTGHGIRRKDLGRIFDPFFTTKAPGEGTGLGLSISHGLVEKAGGTIAIESRHEEEAAPGESGTTFTIHLPLAPQEPEEPRE